jgi:hypothetical protein
MVEAMDALFPLATVYYTPCYQSHTLAHYLARTGTDLRCYNYMYTRYII